MILIISNTSVKMNVMSTEAELFAIRYSINCATQMQDVAHIIIIMDAIPAIKHIFDMSIHPYQLHSIVISNDLRGFFNKNFNNLISFWDCPSSNKWPPCLLVDKELKHLKINTVLPSKSSWEFSRKEKCNSIIYKWQMYFQASEYKGRNFLDLNDDNNQPIHLTYSKGSAWLKHFGLCYQIDYKSCSYW